MFGLIDEVNGDLVADVDVCVLTGQPIETGDAMIRLSGTPYFVRVKADQVKNVTPAVLEALRSQLPQPESEIQVEEMPQEVFPASDVVDKSFQTSRRRSNEAARSDEENS